MQRTASTEHSRRQASIEVSERLADNCRLLTSTEVADRLRCTPRYVALLAERGRLPAVRIGRRCLRFNADDVTALIEAATVRANSNQEAAR